MPNNTMLNLRTLTSSSPDFEATLTAFQSRTEARDHTIAERVRAILADVQTRGDAAIAEYTERFDQITFPQGPRIPAEMIAQATVAPEIEQALQLAANRIRAYHEQMLPPNLDYTDPQGVRLGARWTPVDAVGLYVPGGTAIYPSSVLMNAIPAQVAGVPRIAMTVPTPKGVLSPLLLVAARIAGVTEIHRIGGAQAVAGLAYGTQSIAKVDKIVGPGNAYVAEAKRQLFGTVGIDSIAGPSEILVIADGSTPAEWIAADLLSQAEHDVMASSVLITTDAAYATAVKADIETHLSRLPRAAIARESLENHGAIILARDLDEAAAISDRLAPEHLELAVADPEPLFQRIRHAGAIFIGSHTPEALGDYLAGPSHVLPTSGTARFSSGLSVIDFMKRTSFLGFSPASLASLGPAAVTLAHAETLDAHALSVSLRLKPKP